jgi:hypothetical protein
MRHHLDVHPAGNRVNAFGSIPVLRNKDQLPAAPLCRSSGRTCAARLGICFFSIFTGHPIDMVAVYDDRKGAPRGRGTGYAFNFVPHFVALARLNEKIIFLKERSASKANLLCRGTS